MEVGKRGTNPTKKVFTFPEDLENPYRANLDVNGNKTLNNDPVLSIKLISIWKVNSIDR